MIYDSFSYENTLRFAYDFSKDIKGGTVICLDGEIGAGKTVFAKGFALGLGIDDDIVSPTFTIMQVYDGGRLPLYHFDAYRISDSDEMYEIGFEDYLFGSGVCIIEWSELIEDIIPDSAIKIRIDRDVQKGLDYRRITVEGL
ncbi:tRNA (adenosine(37)-N6)-threonylcarbamoyltransferase complex ATPase subunit type 1 TsaE [Johnsonella ignava]|uniref:tRNA (adenosine(37)-N6)-threonylcarbamoyltransferase complex ATPase subunit type 1 TsaE n=1 Tax=Johnsonella ignava TaxID=43995 RepID=UPI0023F2153E|nr:tRNA (adenosine(37)-N6)-threonylcarbamoyltransferase complex ATPase subunit type 1 TsaE [Johnsonella ignava]